jgi:hypothetical protein
MDRRTRFQGNVIPVIQRVYQGTLKCPYIMLVNTGYADTLCLCLIGWIQQRVNILSRSSHGYTEKPIVVYVSEPYYIQFLERSESKDLLVSPYIRWVYMYRANYSIGDTIGEIYDRVAVQERGREALWVIWDINECLYASYWREWMKLVDLFSKGGNVLLIGSHGYVENASLSWIKRNCIGILDVMDSGASDDQISRASFSKMRWPLVCEFHHKGEIERVSIELKSQLLSFMPEKKPIVSNPESVDTLQQLSTFRVKLTPQEQKQRGDIDLPFLKIQSNPIEPRTGLPNIIYYAEKIDDMDEEDPDADLDL